MSGLGPLEADVLHAVWDRERDGATVHDVLAALSAAQPARDLAYTTVITVMERLRGKKLLLRERRGRAYVYRPALSEAEFVSASLRSLLDASSDRAGALLHFTEQLDEADIDELRRALGSGG